MFQMMTILNLLQQQLYSVAHSQQKMIYYGYCRVTQRKSLDKKFQNFVVASYTVIQYFQIEIENVVPTKHLHKTSYRYRTLNNLTFYCLKCGTDQTSNLLTTSYRIALYNIQLNLNIIPVAFGTLQNIPISVTATHEQFLLIETYTVRHMDTFTIDL